MDLTQAELNRMIVEIMDYVRGTTCPPAVLAMAAVVRSQLAPSASDSYLIWSVKHGMWYMPNEARYTNSALEAGRYTLAHGNAICKTVNFQADKPNVTLVPC